MSRTRQFVAAALVGLFMLATFAGPAAAQEQDGLVNVMIGDVTILEDVNIGVAAIVVAQICDVRVGPVAVLGRAVDRSGDSETVCTVETGDVTITQN